MAAQDVTELEINENIIWSTNRLYLSLLETFPKYVATFQAKWDDWQQAISAEEFVFLNHPSIIHPSANLPTAHQPGPRSPLLRH